MRRAATTDPPRTRTVICTVTHDDAHELDDFVAALERLQPAPSAHAPGDGEGPRCVVVDCASGDGSAARARELARDRPWLECHALERNVGFAGGMNRAIELARARHPRWIWSLNADTRPQPRSLVELWAAARCQTLDGAVGAVTPRLLRFPEADGTQRLDACGMVLTHTWRHLDRGADELDRGQYAQPQEVFGGTGAATLYALDALEDVAFDGGEIFDELFHSYREDAELCFRLQRRGWRVVYQPHSQVLHRRAVTPERRREVAAAINRRSLQNRYLLRAYHQSLRNACFTGLPAWLRDVGILLYVAVRERSSVAAYGWLWRHRQLLRQRRRWLRQRDRPPPGQVERWFGRSSRPLASAPAADAVQRSDLS